MNEQPCSSFIPVWRTDPASKSRERHESAGSSRPAQADRPGLALRLARNDRMRWFSCHATLTRPHPPSGCPFALDRHAAPAGGVGNGP